MPMTVIAFSESISPNVLQNIAGVADPHVTVSGDDIIIPSFANKVIAAFGVGTTLDRMRLVSPRLRKINNIEMVPVQRGATAPGSPPAIYKTVDNPVELDVNEALNVEALQSAAASERETCIVFLADAAPSPVTGADIRTVRCTTSVTLTANAWTNTSLTFTETLPAGRYQVIGMRARSSNLIAARLVLVGEAYRPGCLGVTGIANLEDPMFRHGHLGVFGEFEHNTPPTVDFFASAADTDPEVELDLVKVG